MEESRKYRAYAFFANICFQYQFIMAKNDDIKFFKNKSMQSGFCFHCPKISVMKSVFNK